MKAALTLVAAVTLAGCAATPVPPDPQADPQGAFFAALTARCGQAYAGEMVSDQPADAEMRGKPMVMHVRTCTADRIEIPFHIETAPGDWDRSRTWIVSRTAGGLRLKHDHRHKDGEADKVTLYGGDTADAGTATRQSFPVDAESIAMFRANDLAASTTNVWAIEATPLGFTYELTRAGRDFRVAFAWDRPVSEPPAPWGW
ncbi:hypothetical protein [Sphingopyxis sp.]|uniref:hypothetical protein n=1 Tax=Sphingopyxis sp. TaxID=1908224 RepID=UPI003D80EFE7